MNWSDGIKYPTAGRKLEVTMNSSCDKNSNIKLWKLSFMFYLEWNVDGT